MQQNSIKESKEDETPRKNLDSFKELTIKPILVESEIVDFDYLKRESPYEDNILDNKSKHQEEQVSNIANFNFSDCKANPSDLKVEHNIKKDSFDLNKSLKKVKSNQDTYHNSDEDLDEIYRLSLGAFMKTCVLKKSKLELDREALLEREKQLKISKGLMEEESIGNMSSQANFTRSEILDIRVSKYEGSEDKNEQLNSNNTRNSRYGLARTTSQNKSRNMSELLKSKSRLSSPNGGNIYLCSTIVDELEINSKSRKISFAPRNKEESELSENSNKIARAKKSIQSVSPS